MTSDLKTNLAKLNWHIFCFGFAPYLPIIFLFFRSTGLSFAQIGVISASQWFAQLLLEVPTGVFADKFGRKTAMAIAAALLSISYLLFFLGSSFTAFIIANFIFGSANSFLAGSDTSFIHDSLQAEGKENEFSKHLGKYFFYYFLSSAISSLVVSFLPVGHYRLTFALAIPFALISFFAVSSTNEPKISEHSEKRKFWKHLSEAFKKITSQTEIISIVVYYLILTTVIQIFFRYMQFFMHDAGINLKYNGVLYALFVGIAAVMSQVAHSAEKILKKNGSLLALALSVVTSLLILSQSSSLAPVMVAFILIELSYGFLRPVISDYFHQLIESHNRATVDSLKGFGLNISLVIFLPLFGYVSDKLGIEKMALCLALLTFAVVAVPLTKLLKFKNT